MKKILFLLLATFIFKASALNAQDDKFKALFIYNFTKMVEWPADQKSGDFVIGIIGNTTIASEISGLNKKVVNQPIVVKEISDAGGITDCHILFIGSSSSAQLAGAIAKVGGKPTLVVSDAAGLCSKGSGINFVKSDSGIDYEYNLANITKQGLNVSLDFKSLGKACN